MAQRKGTKRTKRKPESKLAELQERLRGGDLAGWGRGLVISGWVLLATAFVLGLFMGVPAMRRAAAAASPPTAVQVAFVDAPAWMQGDLAAHLEITAADQIVGNALERADLVAARNALLETGWFTDVRQVRRVSPDRVEVEASFVEPYAVVRDRDGDHLVDPSGRLLPRSAPIGHAPQFIAIEGAYYERPTAIGAQWEGADLTAALRLLRLIYGKEWREQAVAIDVSDYMQTEYLAIITDRGHSLLWGSAPGEERSGEAPTDLKEQYLDYPFVNFGHIDGGHEVDLDLTSPRGVFTR